MNTKHSTPILNAIRQQHAEEDKRRGVDPYNTGRHKALLLHGPTADQQLAADLLLAASSTHLRLRDDYMDQSPEARGLPRPPAGTSTI